MPSLETTYLGLTLRSPLVASAGPLTKDIGHVLHLEDAGLSAVVMHSLFEEQITIESESLSQHLDQGTESFAESLSYFPDLSAYNIGPEGYLEHLRKIKQSVGIPVIGSLNGVSTGGWIRYARLIEQAGADALELNIYNMPTDPRVDAAAVERSYAELVSHVTASVRIPVAVKLGPYFTSLPHMALQLDQAGAAGLVLFNRFYQPDLDLETLNIVPSLVLSTSNELPLRLHWVALLYGRIQADMAVSGGVHSAGDVLKSMMVGARVAMMTSALLRQGIGYAKQVEADLTAWMEEYEYDSIRQMQASMSARNVRDPSAFERGNYMKVLSSYDQHKSSSWVQ